MEAVLLVVHLIVALGIIILVLIQPAESGGFLGSGGSMSNMMAPRRKGDGLTRATGFFAAAFFVTSLLLAVVATHTSKAQPASILDAAEQVAPAAPADQAKPDAPAVQDEQPSEPKAPIAQ